MFEGQAHIFDPSQNDSFKRNNTNMKRLFFIT